MTMDLGVVSRAKGGETVNGDAWFLDERDGLIFLAVIDGIGHGEAASEAALKATAFLKDHVAADLLLTIRRCHDVLLSSRGAVMGLVSINMQTRVLSYAGVGNIEARIIKMGEYAQPVLSRTLELRPKVQHLISMPGIVGRNLKRVKEFQYSYDGGDIVVMFSDGISSRLDIFDFLPAQNLHLAAEEIFRTHGKDDDATVLLAR